MRFDQPKTPKQPEATAVPVSVGTVESEVNNVQPAVENLLETRDLPVPVPTGITDVELFSFLNAEFTENANRQLVELVPITTDTSVLELSMHTSTTPVTSLQQEMSVTKNLPTAANEQQISKDSTQPVREREALQETRRLGAPSYRQGDQQHSARFAERRHYGSGRHLPTPPHQRHSRSPDCRRHSRGEEGMTFLQQKQGSFDSGRYRGELIVDAVLSQSNEIQQQCFIASCMLVVTTFRLLSKL